MHDNKPPTPQLYLPPTNIDRHQCKRVVPMEVLSLGWSRTGTSSMKAALQILGYNDVYHMANNWGNALDTDMWNDAYKAKYKLVGKPFGRAEWDQLLGHCMATTDVPAMSFAPELIDAYPEAKVILCERDVEKWNQSVAFIINASFSPAFRIFAWTDPFWMGKLHRIMMWNMHADFKARTAQEAKANAKQCYLDHYAMVRRITPKERLLNYTLGDGWEPLCEFLGKPVPDVPFPHLNETKSLQQFVDYHVSLMLKRSLRNLAVVVSVMGVLGYGVYRTIL
ncbi:hypothetical protein BP5796_03633 [Coleophoma crateriformis]|uniref:Uncharacterized protein n=1 Tax=Coleophoma crateriformis TaxID=565419 RepID=A0A3D8SNN1_9HELO|nr:hypothetical protein BP5796_03633 [Coleophoma crateriformis]